jgi:hypothetical protein
VGWEGAADIALESPRAFEGYRFLPAGSDPTMFLCAMMSPALRRLYCDYTHNFAAVGTISWPQDVRTPFVFNGAVWE